MPVDVIMATYGAKEAVEASLTAAFEMLPQDCIYHIYDSPASVVDGTRDWLLGLNGRSNVNIEFGDRCLLHWQALDYLATKCTTEWVLAMDSDLILTKPGVLEHMLARLGPRHNLAGEIVPMYAVPTRKMLVARIHAKLCLFRRQWFFDNKLSWQVYYIPLFNCYPWIHDQLRRSIGNVYFDTGAQLYHLAESTRSARGFRLSHCYKHISAASVAFRRKYHTQLREIETKHAPQHLPVDEVVPSQPPS